MVASRVIVVGEKRVAATMIRAGHDLQHMDAANARVAAGLAQRARGAAPKRSGALARSTVGRAGSNNSAEVVATIVYAGVIHNGWRRHNIRPQPYLSRTVEESESTWLAAYTAEVQRICDRVQGV